MCNAWSSPVLALTMLSVATWLPCQATPPGRSTHPGRVLDGDRKPVAGAKVVLVAPAAHAGLEAGDVVRTDTDAAGRFRAGLLPAMPYLAWASLERDADRYVTSLVEVGADAIELTIPAKPQQPLLSFTGANAWKEFGPLRVRIDGFDVPSLVVEGDLDAEGRLASPAYPGHSYWVSVFCAGKLVYATDTSLDAIALPPPHRLPVRVADDKDKPIAGATVHRSVPRWSQHDGPFPSRPKATRVAVATTADDGTAELLVAAEENPIAGKNWAMLTFVATKDGYADGISGRTQSAFCNGKCLDSAQVKAGVLPFVMRAGRAATIKVELPPGHGASAAQWLGQHTVPYQNNSRTSVLDGATLPLVDGRLTMPLASAEGDQAGTIEFLLGELPLAADDPWARLARPRVLVVPQSTLIAESKLDLRDVQPLRILVLDAAGGPAIAARLVCAPKSAHEFIDPSHGTQTTTDRTGRALLCARPGEWIVAVMHGASFVHAIIEVKPDLAPRTLRLEALPRMQVVVRDGDGKPVEGVMFAINGASWSGGGNAENEWQRQLAWPVTESTLRRARSGADGRADLSFLPTPGVELRLRATHGGRQTKMPRLEATDEPVEVILR